MKIHVMPRHLPDGPDGMPGQPRPELATITTAVVMCNDKPGLWLALGEAVGECAENVEDTTGEPKWSFRYEVTVCE